MSRRPASPSPARGVGLLTAEDLARIGPAGPDALRFRLVTEADEWLEAAWKLLTAGFDPNVLDPFDRYVRWLDMNRRGTHPYPFLMMVAFLPHRKSALVAGVVAGNIMAVEAHDGPNPPGDAAPWIYAIGHQITAPAARAAGLRGIGTART